MSNAARAGHWEEQAGAIAAEWLDDEPDCLRLAAQIKGLADAFAAEQTAALRTALDASTGQLKYWLRTYRNRSGFMNATQLAEQEVLRKRVKEKPRPPRRARGEGMSDELRTKLPPLNLNDASLWKILQAHVSDPTDLAIAVQAWRDEQTAALWLELDGAVNDLEDVKKALESELQRTATLRAALASMMCPNCGFKVGDGAGWVCAVCKSARALFAESEVKP